MNYQGHARTKVLVIKPDVADAILTRREKLGLPPVPVEELEYGNDELMEVVNELGGKALIGKRANLLGLLAILREGWDVIWLITHGEEEGWYLEDGLVNASEMTSIIRSSGAFLTVMNTCSSMEVAKKAAKELGTAFICTISPVPDRQAFITGILFAQKLSAGYDYTTAYELARPGQTHPYILIEAREDMRPDHPNFQGRGTIDSATLHKFIRSVEELDQIINGSQRLGLTALKDIVKNLQADLHAIKEQLAEIQERQKMRNAILWGMGTMIAILIVTVVFLGLRLGGTI